MSYLQAQIFLIYPSLSTKRLLTPGKALLLPQGKHKTGSEELDIPSLSSSHLLSHCSCITESSPAPFPLGSPLPALALLRARALIPVSREFPPSGAALAWLPARETSSRPLLPAALAKAERAFLGAGAAEPLRLCQERRMLLER